MRWLLRLYPRLWRERYEEEMLAVLEEHKVTPATVLDILLGALDANLNYDRITEGVSYIANKIRAGIVMIFYAFMLFGIGWAMLQRITDPMPNFQAIDTLHPEFGILFNAVFIIGCLSFLAFLIGGLPVFFMAVKRAFQHKNQNVLTPFWIALACLLLFVISTVVLAAWHPEHHIYTYLLGYLILSALFFVVGTVAVSLVIVRTEFQLSELNWLFIPEIAILFSMIVSVVLSTIFIIAITVHAPQLFNTQDVDIHMFTIGIFFMALGTIFASLGIKRGMDYGATKKTW